MKNPDPLRPQYNNPFKNPAKPGELPSTLKPGEKPKTLQEAQMILMGSVFRRNQETSLPAVQAALAEQVNVVIAELAKQSVRATLLVSSQNHGVKSMESAWRKINSGTNWVDIRDMARCTVVVERLNEIETAVKALETHFGNTGVSGFTVEHNWAWEKAQNAFARIHEYSGKTNKHGIRTKEETVKQGTELWSGEAGRQGRYTRATVKNAGYSGATLNVSKQSWKGEIQINIPEMMYAKDLHDFESAYGPVEGPKMVAKMRATYGSGVQGGLGHKLYERIRVLPVGDPKRIELEEASMRYYDYFRDKPVRMMNGRKAMDAILKIHPPVR